MTVPQNVLDQDKAADAALEQYLGDAPADANPQKEPEVVVPEGDGTPAPAAVQPTPPVTVDEVAELTKQLALEKQRNNSLQGRLESQLRPMNDKVRTLQTQIAELQKKNTAVPDVPPHKRHLKPEEIQQLDEGALTVQGKVAQGVAESESDKVRAELESAKREYESRLAALEADRASAATQDLWDVMETLSPGAKQLNAGDANWFAFLDGVDEYSGKTRRDIGELSANVNDVKRLVMLVDEFKATQGRPAPAAPVTPAAVKPEVSKGASPAATKPAKPWFKESEIRRFYAEFARGRYNGREEEANKLEAQIVDAVADKRIAPE